MILWDTVAVQLMFCVVARVLKSVLVDYWPSQNNYDIMGWCCYTFGKVFGVVARVLLSVFK